jgi:cellobiose phosphorylase
MIGPTHPDFGKCSNSWLTGTASWMYFAATRYILGVRPDYEGLVLEPCVPEEWKGFEVTRMCRGRKIRIMFSRSDLCIIKTHEKEYEGRVLPWDEIESIPYGSELDIKVFFSDEGELK